MLMRFMRYFLLLSVLCGLIQCLGKDKNTGIPDVTSDDSATDIILSEDISSEDEIMRDEGDRFLDSDKDGIYDRREEILGTDPLNPDTDGDGIMDGEELKDKTDPLNPSSARAYHPEYSGRCRLFFDCEEGDKIREHIRKRIDEQREPYLTLYKRIESVAKAEIPHYPGNFDTKVSPMLGEIAESGAFLGWLNNDNDYINKALQAISEPFPDPTNVSSSAKYNLYESEALVSFCTAFEFIRAANIADDGLLNKARENLIKRINYFREITHNGTYAIQLAYLNNNHKTKVLSALGLCALLFNERKEAAFEISSAMTGIDYIMTDFQNSDGFYAEGPNYLVYTDNSFLPFMFAYHRFSGGKEYKFYGVENIAGGSPHAGKVVSISDFAVNENIIDLYKRALFITQPDGLMLPVDDANPSCLHGAVHYRIFDNKDFLWQWYKPSCGFYSNKLNALSLLLLTDDEPPESPASVPAEASYPDGGLAILRDSFGGSGTFFALVGENGKIRTNGLGHEHPDELSFTLWAYGVPLVIDPGYINWDNHNLVKYSKDHSVILIDGEGSGYDELRNQIGTDAFLGDIESSTMVASLIGRTSYRGSDIRRSVVRVNKNYFLLFDSVKLPDSLTHTVSVQINGAGGGDIEDSSFEIGPNGAVYLREGVSLSIFVLSDGDNLSFSSRREEYARVWGVYGYNDMFIAEAEAKNNIYFLTLLVTSQKKTENVVSSMISKELFYYKWSDESYEYFAVLNNTSGDQQITDSGSVLSVPRGLSVIILSGGKEIERRKIEYSLLNKG